MSAGAKPSVQPSSGDPNGGSQTQTTTNTKNSLLVFERVHARDEAGPRGKSRGGLSGLSFALGAGAHAIVGAPEDGTIALSELVAGVRAPLRGNVLIAGREPSRTPAIRARIGSLNPVIEMPEAASVDAAVELAMRARGQAGASADSILAPLGLSSLRRRRPRSLSFVEARAVELALALTTPAPLVIALFEPLVDVAVQPLAVVRDRIRELASSGACVLLITSSPADAAALADRVHVLQRGFIMTPPGGEDSVLSGRSPGAPAEIVVWVRDPDGARPGVRELAAALSSRPEARSIAWEEHRGAGPGGSSIRVRGDSLEACSRVILDAALETGAQIDAMAPVTPGLAQVRAAANALFARRYANPAALAPSGLAKAAPKPAAPSAPAAEAPAALPESPAESPVDAQPPAAESPAPINSTVSDPNTTESTDSPAARKEPSEDHHG